MDSDFKQMRVEQVKSELLSVALVEKGGAQKVAEISRLMCERIAEGKLRAGKLEMMKCELLTAALVEIGETKELEEICKLMVEFMTTREIYFEDDEDDKKEEGTAGEKL